MSFTEIITAIGTFIPIGQTLLEWGIGHGEKVTAKKADIAKAYVAYKTELQHNWSILERLKLEEISTKDISNPAVVSIAGRLKTDAAEKLLLALLAEIQNPQKAVKKLPAAAKVDTSEAKKLIKAIIFVMDKTRELQCFTTLTEAEQRILRGFYVKVRLTHIIEKTQYLNSTCKKR